MLRILRNTNASVDYTKLDRRRCFDELHIYLAAGGRVVQRIVDEIHDRLVHLAVIEHKSRECRRHCQFELNVFALRHLAPLLQLGFDDSRQVHR